MVRHVIKTNDLTPEQLRTIFIRMIELKKCFYPEALKGMIIALIFFEPSTRTWLSFSCAISLLGGVAKDVLNPETFSSFAKGESLSDMIRVISGNVHCIVLRTKEPGLVEQVAKHSLVPVINAGDGGNEHPTQAYLDLNMVWEAIRVGSIPKGKKLRILFFGDNAHSRTVRSFAKLLASHGPALGITLEHVGFFGQKEYAIPPEDVSDALLQTCNVTVHTRMPSLANVDVVYVTRPQKERHVGPERESLVFTPELAQKLPEHAMILHPMPRNSELPESVDSDPRARWFEQSDRGMLLRMALLYHLLHN